MTPDNELVYQRPKNGQTKHLAIDRQTLYDLSAWKRSAERRKILDGRTSPWVFLSTHRPWSSCRPATLAEWWRRHAVPAGLGHLRFHGLRHLHATSLLSSGVPLHAVTARLGHSTPKTTLGVYSHAQPHHDRAIADYVGLVTSRVRPPVSATAGLASVIEANVLRLTGEILRVDPDTRLADVDALADTLGVELGELLDRAVATASDTVGG